MLDVWVCAYVLYIYRERDRQTDRQTDKETETDRQRHTERAACTWRLRYHATVNPPLNCLQLVDILHRVQIPDRACELQRWPNQGFVCLLLDGHGVHLPVPPQEPVLLALLVILVVCKSQRRSQRRSSESVTPRHLVSLVNLRGWPRLTPSTGLRHPSLDEHAGKRCSECGDGHEGGTDGEAGSSLQGVFATVACHSSPLH